MDKKFNYILSRDGNKRSCAQRRGPTGCPEVGFASLCLAPFVHKAHIGPSKARTTKKKALALRAVLGSGKNRRPSSESKCSNTKLRESGPIAPAQPGASHQLLQPPTFVKI